MRQEDVLADEDDVLDIGSWFMTLVRSWWIILGCVLLGALTAAIVTWLMPEEYKATASVYIGQTTDANGNPMAGLNSNARAATQLLASDSVLREAARRAGADLTDEALRAQVTVEVPTAIRNSSSVVNIVVIDVKDENKKRAAASANALATILLEEISQGVEEKIVLLEEQLVEDEAAFENSVENSRAAQAALRELSRRSGGADESATAPYLAVVQAAATEQQALQSAIQKTQLLLLTARQVEMPSLLNEATAPSSRSGPDLALNVAAGALAGFVVGVVLAFVRRHYAERRSPS